MKTKKLFLVFILLISANILFAQEKKELTLEVKKELVSEEDELTFKSNFENIIELIKYTAWPIIF